MLASQVVPSVSNFVNIIIISVTVSCFVHLVLEDENSLPYVLHLKPASDKYLFPLDN